ncbi:hypothetical protein AFLA_008532 [Aspergillus flavus NRRL3357]|nr:hypothetical protein AFLA_008532 [Aspergillus flavus NRRL3357]
MQGPSRTAPPLTKYPLGPAANKPQLATSTTKRTELVQVGDCHIGHILAFSRWVTEHYSKFKTKAYADPRCYITHTKMMLPNLGLFSTRVAKRKTSASLYVELSEFLILIQNAKYTKEGS